jgi:hypothetical protein
VTSRVPHGFGRDGPARPLERGDLGRRDQTCRTHGAVVVRRPLTGEDDLAGLVLRNSFHRDGRSGVQLDRVPFVFAVPFDVGAIDGKHDQQGVWPRQPTGVHGRVVVPDIDHAHQCLWDADETCVVRFQGPRVLFRSEERPLPAVGFGRKGEPAVPAVLRIRIDFPPWPLDRHMGPRYLSNPGRGRRTRHPEYVAHLVVQAAAPRHLLPLTCGDRHRRLPASKATGGPGLLLALGLSGDLAEPGFCWSEAVDSDIW